jgi:hypothetical protein
MARGKKLDRSTQRWAHIRELRDVRDRQHQHLKAPYLGVGYKRLGNLMNLFRTGIAGTLLDLHVVFDDRDTPAVIVRYDYLPDIEYVPTPE